MMLIEHQVEVLCNNPVLLANRRLLLPLIYNMNLPHRSNHQDRPAPQQLQINQLL
jgi:hypothetical protein